MKRLTVIHILGVFVITVCLSTCQSQTSGNKLKQLHQDLIVVTDSISQLMSDYHYNPAELATDEYLDLEQKIGDLAKTVQSKQEFIDGFNVLWSNGPFSHVRLAFLERPAKEMANFIDSMEIGNQGVSLKWMGKTAVLNVTTMTGIDTKEKIFEGYREIARNEAESLIIDLRNNTGGTFAGIPLIGHLIKDSIDAGLFVSRKWWKNHSEVPNLLDAQDLSPWNGWSIKTFWHDVQEQPLTRIKFVPMTPQFRGPTYVLISKKTASAAEFTVDALAQVESVIIIGETTAGEMLSQKMYDLPHGFQLSLPIAEYYSHRIGKIEGKGVEPEIVIDQNVAIDVAFSLIEGEKPEDAISSAQKALNELKKQPLGEPIYLLGSMNGWGNNPDMTPQFEFMGEGVYETTTTLKKGQYEFKIASMDWSFDFGANSNQENVTIGQKTSLASTSGSNNLKINILEESLLRFSLYVSNEKAVILHIYKN